MNKTRSLLLVGAALCLGRILAAEANLQRIKYNNPGLVVDLGVGLWAWPLPMDWDGDGDLDLVVSCPDKPYNGIYFFENPGGQGKFPVFKPGVRIGAGLQNVQVSVVDGKPRVLTPGVEWIDFTKPEQRKSVQVYANKTFHAGKLRANQWRYLDYDGDGALDLIVGIEDWAEYGWDNAFSAEGKWTRGPLHGYVYLLRNKGATEKPEYEPPVKVEAGGKPIDGFGMPSPSFADFDGDGDLDLICGEFLDGFTYYQNTGARNKPVYAAGQRLLIAMDLQMITPTAINWDGDGDTDLICGDEDGRVALIEHTGKIENGVPRFLAPRYFQQQADDVKFGALATPVSADWDGDGDEDLVCGNTAGYIGLIENLGGNPPKWAAPKYLEAGGKTICFQAGPNGSIQGPAEAKWGYTTLSVADWDHDGLHDLVVNSISGKVVWFRNSGTRAQPKLDAAQPVIVAWAGAPPKPAWNWWNPSGKELVTQWRTTPLVADFTGDKLNDLAMLDHEGFLALFERCAEFKLLPGKHVFFGEGRSLFDSNHTAIGETSGLLRLNNGSAGRSGRRKLCVADWDGDGKLDLLVNSRNVNWLKNVSTKDGEITFRDMGPLDGLQLAGHDTSPTVVDWNKDGVPDLLVGAEDGYFYYLKNPRAKGK